MADALHGGSARWRRPSTATPAPARERASPPARASTPSAGHPLPSHVDANHPGSPTGGGRGEGDPEAVPAWWRSTRRLSWADIAAVARAHCRAKGLRPRRLGRGPARRLVARGEAVRSGSRQRPVRPGTACPAWPAGGDGSCRPVHDRRLRPRLRANLRRWVWAVALAGLDDDREVEEAADLFEEVAVTDPSWVAAIAGQPGCHPARPSVDAARVYTAVPAGHLRGRGADGRLARLMEAVPTTTNGQGGRERVRTSAVRARARPDEAELRRRPVLRRPRQPMAATSCPAPSVGRHPRAIRAGICAEACWSWPTPPPTRPPARPSSSAAARGPAVEPAVSPGPEARSATASTHLPRTPACGGALVEGARFCEASAWRPDGTALLPPSTTLAPTTRRSTRASSSPPQARSPATVRRDKGRRVLHDVRPPCRARAR